MRRTSTSLRSSRALVLLLGLTQVTVSLTLKPHLQDSAASLACERAGLTCTFAPRYVILRLSLHLSLARRSTAPDGAPPLRTCHLQWLPTLRRQCRHARLASGPPLPCPRIAAATGFFSRRRRRPCSSSTAACTSPSWSRRRSRMLRCRHQRQDAAPLQMLHYRAGHQLQQRHTTHCNITICKFIQ